MTLALSLVDTNVASYFIKEPPHTRARPYESILEGHTLILSFMSLAEILCWAEVGGWGGSSARPDENVSGTIHRRSLYAEPL